MADESGAKPKRKRRSSSHKRKRRSNPLRRLLSLLISPFIWVYVTILRAFRRIRRSIRKRRSKRRGFLGTLWAGFVFVFIQPITLLATGLWQLFVGWSASRRARAFILGLPSFVIASMAIGTILLAKYSSKEKLEYRYAVAVQDAMNDDDLNAAKVYCEKLTALDPEREAYRYQLAVIAGMQKDYRRLVGLMNSLAPEERPGYADAHYWVASQIMSSNQALTSQEASKVRLHLNHAITAQDNHVQARMALANIEIASGDFEQALQHLDVISDNRPEVILRMANLEKLGKNQDSAELRADDAESILRNRLKTDTENVDYVILLADCLLVRNQYRAAIDMLGQAFNRKQDPKLAEAVAKVCVIWADEIEKRAGADSLGQRLQLIETALRFVPNHPNAFYRLATIAESGAEGSEVAVEKLQDLLVSGTAPASVHMLLGTKAAKRGDQKMASFHLEQANRINPRIPSALNNLAWVYLNMKDSDLDDALQLVNSAIEIDPSQATFYDTRGKIYVELGRYEDAVTDLTKALNDLPENVSLHEALVKSYSNLGYDAMVSRHQKRIDEIRGKSDQEAP